MIDEQDLQDTGLWNLGDSVAQGPSRGDAVVLVRFTAQEFDHICREAEAVQVSVTEYVRQVVLVSVLAEDRDGSRMSTPTLEQFVLPILGLIIGAALAVSRVNAWGTIVGATLLSANVVWLQRLWLGLVRKH